MSTDQLIRITSWNVAGKEPTNGTILDNLFDDSKRFVNLRPDIQIVGLQEAPQYLFSDPWTNDLSSTLRRRGYILFKRHKLSGILLYIFVLREIMLRARDFETESVKTGFGGLLGNKGGVSLRFTLNGNSISVTNSHLAAHQEHLQQRIDDYKSIMDGTKFLIDKNTSSILTHDYSFWFGDLNFRLDDIEKSEVLNIINKSKTSKTPDEFKSIISQLHKNDQLLRSKSQKKVFNEFDETLPVFPPTYKFQIGSKDEYDSEQRIPAWTDRILYRNVPQAYEQTVPEFKNKIEQLYYDVVSGTELSDHKPVTSLFRVTTFDPEKYNPSPIPYEVIKFEPISGWKNNEDGRVWYKVSNKVFYMRPKILSSWDRLALYKSDFKSLDEYLTIVFANNIARISPGLDAQELPYPASNTNSRSSTPAGSRRSSTSSQVSVGVEAISLNIEGETSSDIRNPTRRSPSTEPNSANVLPDDAVIGDGFKYFTATFSDDVLIPGNFTILYLKTNSANEYSVYGISEPFTIV